MRKWCQARRYRAFPQCRNVAFTQFRIHAIPHFRTFRISALETDPSMNSDRTSDLAILLGHAFQCEDCRKRLLEEPDRVLVGRKLTQQQRERLTKLTPQDFGNSQTLATAVA